MKHITHAIKFLAVVMIFLLLQSCSGSIPKSAMPAAPGMQTAEATQPAVEVPNTPTIVPTETSTPSSTPSPSPTLTPPPSPTPTLPPPPVAVLVPRLYKIDLTKGGDVPPDLLEYVIDYYPSGGGGGNCNGEGGAPSMLESYRGTSLPAVPQTLNWEVAGLQMDLPIQVSLTLPDRSLNSYEAFTNFWGCTFFQYEVVPGTILGTYTIEFRQGSTLLTDSFTLAMPTDPFQTVYEGTEWFLGFEPDEQVTLWTYFNGSPDEFLQPEIASLFPDLAEYSKVFKQLMLGNYSLNAFFGQQTVLADEYGAFQVQYTSEQVDLADPSGLGSQITTVAQGEISGFPSGNRFAGSCNGSLPTRLAIGDTAVVTEYAEQEELYVFETGDTLSPGTLMTVRFGPLCSSRNDGIQSARWLWIVENSSNTDLVTYECDTKGYFLKPVDP